jgi:pimeloyl-ACP methyl ester carboxylesterase
VEFQTISGGGLPHVVSISGQGPDVVLVHGFPDTPYSWAEIEGEVVRAGFRVVVPWLRGYHPDTIVPGRRYDPETIGRDALALLDAIGSNDAAIVGHDWGALIAYVAASLAPERVRGIVTLGIPHPTQLRPTPRLLWQARHFAVLKLPWAASLCRRDDFAYLDKLYRRWAPRWSGAERDTSLSRAKEALSNDATLSGALGYYRDLPRSPTGVTARVPPVRGLVVGGSDEIVDHDRFTPTAERLRQPSRALIVQEAGHWPHRERPELVLPQLLAFLEPLPAS